MVTKQKKEEHHKVLKISDIKLKKCKPRKCEAYGALKGKLFLNGDFNEIFNID